METVDNVKYCPVLFMHVSFTSFDEDITFGPSQDPSYRPIFKKYDVELLDVQSNGEEFHCMMMLPLEAAPNLKKLEEELKETSPRFSFAGQTLNLDSVIEWTNQFTFNASGTVSFKK